jgi:hypothetical protein
MEVPQGRKKTHLFPRPFCRPWRGLFHFGRHPAVETAGYSPAPLRGCHCRNVKLNY